MFDLFIFILMIMYLTTMFKQAIETSLLKHAYALLIIIQFMKWLISHFLEMTLIQAPLSEAVMAWLFTSNLIQLFRKWLSEKCVRDNPES